MAANESASILERDEGKEVNEDGLNDTISGELGELLVDDSGYLRSFGQREEVPEGLGRRRKRVRSIGRSPRRSSVPATCYGRAETGLRPLPWLSCLWRRSLMLNLEV
jgi:hypothetical protein